MSAENYIEANLSLDGSQDAKQVNWSTVKPKPQKIYHGKGVMPYIPGSDEVYEPQHTSINQLNAGNGSDTMYYPPYVDTNPLDSENLTNAYLNQWNSEILNSRTTCQWSQEDCTNTCPEPWNPQNIFNQSINQWYPENITYSYPYQYNPGDFPTLYPDQEGPENLQINFTNPYLNQCISDNFEHQTSRRNSKEPKSKKVNRKNSDRNPNLIQIQPEKIMKSNTSLNLDQKVKDSENYENVVKGSRKNKLNPNPAHQEKKTQANSKLHQTIPKNKTDLNIEPEIPKIKTSLSIKQKILFNKTELDKKITKNENNLDTDQEVMQKSSNVNHDHSSILTKSENHKTNHNHASSRNNIKQMAVKNFVRTPFMRQKEIDKLKEQVNVIEDEDEYTPKDIFHHSDESDKNKHALTYDFDYSNIIASVRETTGGRNVQSNEAIEQRLIERQKNYMEKQEVDQSSSNESYVTASDESFKTAISFEQMQAFQQSLSEKILNESNVDRHKKNALILGLLKNTLDADDPDLDDEMSNSDEDEAWADAVAERNSEGNAVEDIVNNIDNLRLDGIDTEMDEATLMRGDRLGRFLFQSEEDEDVYVHPLREQIQKDPEWQKVTLRRKGTEIIFSPREYYLNLNDEDFDFQMPKK